MATSSERAAPQVDVINIAIGGILVAFYEPVGLVADERVVLSLAPPDAHGIHLLGRVARVARGIDFRTYVAVSFDPEQVEEIDELQRMIDEDIVSKVKLGEDVETSRRR